MIWRIRINSFLKLVNKGLFDMGPNKIKEQQRVVKELQGAVEELKKQFPTKKDGVASGGRLVGDIGKVIDVRTLLSKEKVEIPEYQRPYKWSLKNVNALLDDIIHFKHQSKYRLGTVVYHKKDDRLFIVDGQQRSVTLSLIALAIRNNKKLNEIITREKFELPKLSALDSFKFTSPISQYNIKQNYREIQNRIIDFNLDTIRFFFDQCEVVKVQLSDISEAFQFFDSQNARGRDLEPHDLLKAFHLREVSNDVAEEEVVKLVADWESLSSGDLATSFSKYLYRIRSWSKGNTGRSFTKSKVDSFKGVSPTVKEPYPYAAMYRVAHFYIEGYNKDYQRNIDGNEMKFPFQLDQAIINGKRFFEFVQHYAQKIEQIKKNHSEIKGVTDNSIASNILSAINSYKARNRTGDQYVRNLFDTAFIYYVDKFGYTEIERAIEKIFIWSYSLRLKRQSVQLASMDNYALESPYVFKSIREALRPSDFLSISIEPIYKAEYKESNKTGKLNDIVSLFDELNYIS